MDFRYSHEGIDSTAFLVDWCKMSGATTGPRGDDLSGENPGAIAYLFLLELKQCHAFRLQSAMVAHSGDCTMIACGNAKGLEQTL
jgi:hypothetical protein